MDKKNNVIVAIVIILLIAVIAGAFIWFSRRSASQNTEQQPAQQNQSEEMNETADWQTYHDEKYGFEFKYPKSWGDVKVEAVNQNFEREFFDVEDQAKISKISDVQKIISFSNKQNYPISITVTEYSDAKPYEAVCYEGHCSLLNIIDLKKDIETNSNAVIGDVKGKMKDEFFNPSYALHRTYIVILPSYKLEIDAFHDASNLIGSKIPEKEVFLEDLVDLNKTEGVSLDKFIKELNLFIQTFKFTK